MKRWLFLILNGIIAVFLFFSNFALAHDSSTTSYLHLSHAHVKGKITAPNSSVLPLPSGAVVSAKSNELFRWILQECHVNQNLVTSPINPNTGEYELILYFRADI